jgi:cell division protease FtsH
MAPPNPQGPGPGREGPGGPKPQPPSRFSKSLLGWVAFFGLGLLLVTLVGQWFGDRREISIIDFWTYIENRQLTGELRVYDNRIEGENTPDAWLKKGESRRFKVDYTVSQDRDFPERLRQALVKNGLAGVKLKFEVSSWWNTVLPNILLMALAFLAIWFFLFRRLGAGGGGGGFLGSFGRSRHRVLTKEHTKVTFDDVAGIEEAKSEVREIIEFLRNPRKFQRLGGRVPRGVLLVGEPGCGKTLLAKAIAGEAEVPFYSISGSDFVEMFVGVGASRVRDLFRQAKESAPCIIFLDEIDAVGRRRINDYHGGGQETAQTLNAILVEMDGFDTSDQVIVIAATNRSDVLDPALTRPGRFDRQIQVPLPDLTGRFEILKIYAGKVRCGSDVDLRRLARGTPMFSGADLAALVNEAAIAAAMSDKDFIEQADLEEARDKVRWGRARKSRVIDEREKEITAYHEAGHALVQLLTPGTDPLHKVSIIPRGEMGGATYSLPEKDRYLYTRNYCKSLLAVMLGGRVSEEAFCHDISSGAGNDIAQATEVAKRMVLDWGMSDRLGMIRFSTEEKRMVFGELAGKDYSEKTAEIIDQEIKALVDEALATTRKTVEENRQKVQDVAQALLKYETLSGEDVRRIAAGESLDKPTVEDLLQREASRAAPSEGAPARPATGSPKIPPLPQPG